MTLAAYNLGYVNLNLARTLAEEKNLNSNIWSEVAVLEEICQSLWRRIREICYARRSYALCEKN